jgi:hypothetical protein
LTRVSLPRLLLALLLALACTTTAAAQATDQPDTAALVSIREQVSALGGHPALGDVPVRFIDQAGLRDYLRDTFMRDYLPAERESDQKLLLALGLIQPSDDVVQISYNLLSDQVLGLYDPETRAMMIVQGADAASLGPGARVTLAHEYEHALQDQYFNLLQLSPTHPDNYDQAEAIHAVEEGDAVLMQGLWAISNLSPREMAEARRAAGATSSGSLQDIPLVLRSQLLFPYIDGYRFVAGAYHGAGDSYAAVDDLFRNPPRSTAQILHPDKYRAGLAPVEVSLPDLAAALGSGWRTINANVMGELGLRTLIQQYGDRGEADQVTSHWSGDRWALLDHAGQTVVVMKTVWDSPTAAQAFFDAYGRGLRARFRQATVDVAEDQRQALSQDGAATELRLSGQTVLAVIAADRGTAVGVVAAVGD